MAPVPPVFRRMLMPWAQAFEPHTDDPKQGAATRGADVRLESPEHRWPQVIEERGEASAREADGR
jgi:hypothetical protein